MNKKKELWKGLKNQRKLMLENSLMMRAIYGENSNVKELVAAAKITEDWMDEIEKELNE